MIKTDKASWLLLLIYLFSPFLLSAQEEYQPGVVMIKIEQESAARISKKMGKQKVLSSKSTDHLTVDIINLDGIFKHTKATQLTRIIPYNPKYEARYRESGMDLWFELVVDEKANIPEIVKELNSQQEILLAEPVFTLTQTGIENDYPVNDPRLKYQWNYHNTGQNPLLGGAPVGVAGTDIKLFEAWEITMGTPNVVVAIIDGGVDIKHEDIRKNLWINEAEQNGVSGKDDDNNGYIDDIHGVDFVYGRLNIEANEHGTHVGGIVAAKADNGIGIAGVAGGKTEEDGVRLMVCQIFDKDGATNVTAGVKAFIYATDHGAVIAQCSWTLNGINIKQQVLLEAIDYFVEYAGKDVNGKPLPNTPMVGGLPIFAAGNSDTDNLTYPSVYEKCFSVAAIDIDNKKANYSNHAKWIHISAPGGSQVSSGGSNYGQIYSTLPGGYGEMSGTSMACPHVSGVAALVLSKHGSEKYTAEMLKHRLLATASQTYGHDPNYPGRLGAGMVDAYASLTANIPDINAYIYFGDMPYKRNKSYEEKITILNNGTGEMILNAISFSDNDFQVTDFKAGTKIQPGETTQLTVKFTPTHTREYLETLTITYGGDFSGQTTVTHLRANITAEEDHKLTLFYEDFEGSLEGWTLIDNDGDERNWTRAVDVYYLQLAHSGYYYMVSESSKSGGEAINPDNWLITPEIDLTEIPENTDILLSYFVKPYSGLHEEHYKVLVSNQPDKEFSVSDFSHEIISEYAYMATYNDGYNYKEISLKQFAGEKIKIAFVHTKASKGFWLIMDDVEVAMKPEGDFVDIDLPKENLLGYELVKNEEYTLKVALTNNGTVAAETVTLSYQWEGFGEKVSETLSIGANQTLEYKFKNKLLAPNETGYHKLIITADCEQDIIPINNSYEINMWINPYHSLYHWDFEALTFPKEFYRFTYDTNKVSDRLYETSWNSLWAAGREEFLLAQLPSILYPEAGYAFMVSSSYFDPPGKADRWLLIAIPALETEQLIFKWTAFSRDTEIQEDYDIVASTKASVTENPDNPDKPIIEINPEDFVTLKSIQKESSVPNNHLLDVTTYAGKPFYIAFRHLTEQGVVLAIDNIRFMTPEAEPPVNIFQETVEKDLIRLYPNPANDFITVDSDSSVQEIEISNLSGNVIYRSTGNDNQHIINTSSYQEGIYLIKIKTENKVDTQKIIIKH